MHACRYPHVSSVIHQPMWGSNRVDTRACVVSVLLGQKSVPLAGWVLTSSDIYIVAKHAWSFYCTHARSMHVALHGCDYICIHDGLGWAWAHYLSVLLQHFHILVHALYAAIIIVIHMHLCFILWVWISWFINFDIAWQPLQLELCPAHYIPHMHLATFAVYT